MSKPVWVQIHWSENKAFKDNQLMPFTEFERKCRSVAREVGVDNGYDKTKCKILFDDGCFHIIVFCVWLSWILKAISLPRCVEAIFFRRALALLCRSLRLRRNVAVGRKCGLILRPMPNNNQNR